MTTTNPADRARVAYVAGLPGTRGAAAGLIVDDGRVLLVERTYGHPWPWVLPGGTLDAGEAPLTACRREIREELGVEPLIHDLVVVDWVPGDGEQTAAQHWVFTASLPGDGRIRLPTAELRDSTWITPAELDDYLPPHAARRIHAALIAAIRGTTLYLEHGRRQLPETHRAR